MLRGEAKRLAEIMVRTTVFKQFCKDKEKLEQRAQKLQEELRLDSDNIEKLKELAIIYHYIKEDEKAVEIYKKLVKSEPEDAELLAFLGYLYYEMDHIEDAINCLNDSLDIDSGAAFVFFLLGNAYARAGMIREAVDAYDFAIFLDLDMYKAHLDFAKKYEEMGREKRALKEYIAAYEIDSRDIKIKEKIDMLNVK